MYINCGEERRPHHRKGLSFSQTPQYSKYITYFLNLMVFAILPSHSDAAFKSTARQIFSILHVKKGGWLWVDWGKNEIISQGAQSAIKFPLHPYISSQHVKGNIGSSFHSVYLCLFSFNLLKTFLFFSYFFLFYKKEKNIKYSTHNIPEKWQSPSLSINSKYFHVSNFLKRFLSW